jgi:PAS domain S-box-containing protein
MNFTNKKSYALLMQRAVEQSASAIFITDNQGVILFANDAFLQLCGYTKQDIIGKTPTAFSSGIHPKSFYENLWKQILAGKNWTGEICNKNSSGELYWQRTTISPIQLEKSSLHFICTCEPISELQESPSSELNCFPQENPNPIMRFSTNGEFSFLNKPAEKLVSTIKGMLQEKNSPLLKQLAVASQNGAPVEVAFKSHGKYYQFTFILIPDLGMINGYGVDITDSLQAAKLLQEKNELYSKLYMGHSIPMLIMSPETTEIIDANKAAEQFYQQERAALIGLPITKISNSPERNIRLRLQKALSEEKNHFFDRVTISGKQHYVEVWLTPFSMGEKDTVLLASIYDVTESVKAKQESRKQSTQFRHLVESMREGLVITDEKGTITYLNSMFADTLKYPKDVLQQTNLCLYLHEQNTENYQNLMDPDSIVNSSMELMWLDSESRTVITIVSPTHFFSEHGYTGTMLVVTDITHHKEELSKSLQSQKLEAIGQLAAGIAHEINTPTQYVGDNTRFLKESFTDLLELIKSYEEVETSYKNNQQCSPEQLEELQKAKEIADLNYLKNEIPVAIEQTLNGVNRISSIVMAMKRFSHPSGDEKTLANLNDMLETTTTVCRNEWKYVAEIEKKFDKTLPQIPCFPDALNQVFLNIIVNAVHAIAEASSAPEDKGVITITTRQRGQYAIIDISDTGTGISEENMKKIFTPFFTTKEVGKGTGQGLALARSIIRDKHDGDISFKNNPEKGTTFTITLPLEQEDEYD